MLLLNIVVLVVLAVSLPSADANHLRRGGGRELSGGVPLTETEDGTKCSGDCDYDWHCNGNLKCFKRSSGDEVPPGCTGTPTGGNDYCFDEQDIPPSTDLKVIDNHFYQGDYKFTECYGDCDKDDDCLGDLKCWQRGSSHDGPPGCNGDPVGDKDYCFDPTNLENSDTLRVVDRHFSGPWGLCLGDCDNDNDCRGSLRCFQRSSSDPGPPGCLGSPEGDKDYCWDSTVLPATTVLTLVSPKALNGPWPACYGDCSDDDDCIGSLKCFKRSSGSIQPVPGCSGDGVPGEDYCYNDNAPPPPPPPPTTTQEATTSATVTTETETTTTATTTTPPPAGAVGAVLSTGMDWSLPPSVVFTSNTGIHEMSGSPPDINAAGGNLNCHGFTSYWSEISPSDGVYDFSPVNNWIKLIEDSGRDCVILRLKASVIDRNVWGTGPVPFIPQWVLNKCTNVTSFNTKGGGSSFIKVASPWDPCIQKEYALMTHAVASTSGPLSNPHVKGIYVHGISTSAGEEMWLDSSGRDNGIAAGMTVQNLGDAFKFRIEAWAKATKDAGKPDLVKKLAWVRFGYIPPKTGYDFGPLREQVNQRQYDVGMGGRSGGNENWVSVFYRAMRGTGSYDAEWIAYDSATGEATLADEGEKMSDRRPLTFSGTEIEQYSTNSVGTLEFMTSLFVDNFLETKYAWVRKDPTFVASVGVDYLAWWRKTTGVTRAKRPDATLMMYESHVNSNNGCHPLRNVGMSIRQTNALQTPPTIPFDRPGQSRDCGPSGGGLDWRGRSSDVANGIDTFDFELLGPSNSSPSPWNRGWIDDALSSTTEKLCVVINYFPNGAAFRLRNHAGGELGSVQSSYNPTADPLYYSETARFAAVPVATLGRTFSVQVLAGSTADLNIKFVRVIRNCA